MTTRFLKEVGLSIFVMFFRISRWSGSMKARTASSGLTIVEGLIAISFGFWIAVGIHQRIFINPWVVAIALVILDFWNDHVLVDRRQGLVFEEEFDEFSDSKQIALYAGAIVVILAAGLSFYFSGMAYHKAFGIG